MPAFPPENLQVGGTLFDSRRLPSGGGLITEVFHAILAYNVASILIIRVYLTEAHHLSKRLGISILPIIVYGF